MKTLTILSTIVALNTAACSEEQQPISAPIKSCECPTVRSSGTGVPASIELKSYQCGKAPDLQLTLTPEDLSGTYEHDQLIFSADSGDANSHIESIKHDNVLDDVIYILINDGYICQHRGHDWEELYRYRTCRICGKTQTRELSEWK